MSENRPGLLGRPGIVMQRARVVLDYQEGDERTHWAGVGWAYLEGPWLHFYGDEVERWQSWPMQSVVCVEWQAS